MILVDASVFIARLKREQGWRSLTAPITAGPFAVAAITLTEVGLRYRTYTGTAEGLSAYAAAIRGQAAEVIAIDADLALAANDAFAAYGKSTGHPAHLNFGDCLVYAVARRRDLPLLFKGDDFVHTDLTLHPASQDGAGRTLS